MTAGGQHNGAGIMRRQTVLTVSEFGGDEAVTPPTRRPAIKRAAALTGEACPVMQRVRLRCALPEIPERDVLWVHVQPGPWPVGWVGAEWRA